MTPKQLDIYLGLSNNPDLLGEKGEITLDIKYSWVKHLEDMGYVVVTPSHMDIIQGTSRTVKSAFRVNITAKGRTAFTPVAK